MELRRFPIQHGQSACQSISAKSSREKPGVRLASAHRHSGGVPDGVIASTAPLECHQRHEDERTESTLLSGTWSGDPIAAPSVETLHPILEAGEASKPGSSGRAGSDIGVVDIVEAGWPDDPRRHLQGCLSFGWVRRIMSSYVTSASRARRVPAF